MTWFSVFVFVMLNAASAGGDRVGGSSRVLAPGLSVLARRSGAEVNLQGCTFAQKDVPNHYAAYKLKNGEKVSLDGDLSDAAWGKVRWTNNFVDIQGSPPLPAPRYDTRAKMRWDEEYLYVAAELKDPDVWATIEKRNEIIFKDNDFEVFLDPEGDNHDYKEIEMNANNQLWVLRLNKPYGDGGSEDSKRVNKEGGFDIEGIKTAVKVQGSKNDASDRDQGWTLEMAIPLEKVLGEHSSAGMPTPGGVWRINFSRVQHKLKSENGKYSLVEGAPEDNWVWSPQGEIQMHNPEHWGYLLFRSHDELSSEAVEWHDPDFSLRAAAMRLYRLQQQYKEKNGHYATSAVKLQQQHKEDQKQQDVKNVASLLGLDCQKQPQFDFIESAASSGTGVKSEEGGFMMQVSFGSGRHAIIDNERRLTILSDGGAP